MSTDHETPDEIEAALAKREQLLQWAKTVTRSSPAVSLTREWKDYIDARDKGWLEAVTAATGEVLAEERKKLRAEIELEITKLRNEFLADRLDQERGVKRLKVVPQDTLIA